MTPRQRIARLRADAYTPAELATALLEMLREIVDDVPISHRSAVLLARDLAALGHAAALAELCPLERPDNDVPAEEESAGPTGSDLVVVASATSLAPPVYHCAGSLCPGLPYRASEFGHPASCVGPDGT